MQVIAWRDGDIVDDHARTIKWMSWITKQVFLWMQKSRELFMHINSRQARHEIQTMAALLYSLYPHEWLWFSPADWSIFSWVSKQGNGYIVKQPYNKESVCETRLNLHSSSGYRRRSKSCREKTLKYLLQEYLSYRHQLILLSLQQRGILRFN